MPSLSSRLRTAVQPLIRGNRFDRMEWAGAFGDLGTLIPFVVASLCMLSLDPVGVLFTFGLAMWSRASSSDAIAGAAVKAVGAIAPTRRRRRSR